MVEKIVTKGPETYFLKKRGSQQHNGYQVITTLTSLVLMLKEIHTVQAELKTDIDSSNIEIKTGQAEVENNL